MRTLSAGLQAHLLEEVTTLARLFKVVRTDAAEMYFTDNTEPIVFDGDTYRADISFTTSAVMQSADLAQSQQVDITIVMADDAISETALRQGLWKSAVGTLMLINYEEPADGVMVLYNGQFGSIEISDKRRAKIDLLPLSFGVSGVISNERYSPTCRAALGDARCGVDLEALGVNFTVDAVNADGTVITASELTAVDDYFNLGQVKWVTGNNAGLTQTVIDSDQSSTNITLAAVALKPIAVGNTGRVYPGCDKTWATCLAKFNNRDNFRGEPFVPQKFTFQTQDQSSWKGPLNSGDYSGFDMGTYGSIIPITSGHRIVEGKILWSQEKLAFWGWNGPRASFGVAFGYNLAPADEVDAGAEIVRVWMDGVLVFDHSGISNKLSSTFGGAPGIPRTTISARMFPYGGTENQLPTHDRVFEGSTWQPGAPDFDGEAAAYRGLIYANFIDIDLEGLRLLGQGLARRDNEEIAAAYASLRSAGLPVVVAEIVDRITVANTKTVFDLATGSPTIGNDGAFADFSTDEAFGFSGGSPSTDTTIHHLIMGAPYEAADLIEESFTEMNLGEAFRVDDHLAYDPNLRLAFSTLDAGVAAVNVDTGLEAGRYGSNQFDFTMDDGTEDAGNPTLGTFQQTHVARLMDGTQHYHALTVQNSAGGNEELAMLEYSNDGETFTGFEFRAKNAADDTYKIDYPDTIFSNVVFPNWKSVNYGRAHLSNLGQDAQIFVGAGDKLYQEVARVRGGEIRFHNDYGTVDTAGFRLWHQWPGYYVESLQIDDSTLSLMVWLHADDLTHWKLARISLTTGEAPSGNSDAVDNPFLNFRGVQAIPVFVEDNGMGGIWAKTDYEVVLANGPINTSEWVHALSYSDTSDGRFAWPSAGQINVVDLGSGRVEIASESNGWVGAASPWFYDGRNGHILVVNAVPGIVKYTSTLTSGSTLYNTLRWLAIKAGYDEDNVLIDAALTDPVLGVKITSEQDTGSLWRAMGMMYDFENFESEGKIKFTRKGDGAADAEAALDVSKLAPINEGGAFGNESVITRLDIPQHVPQTMSVMYVDPDRAYEQSVQQASTLNVIDATDTTQSEIQISIPIVMTGNEARERVLRALHKKREQSATQRFRLPWEFLALEATDVVTVTVNTFEYIVRITQITYNTDWSLSVEGVNNSFRADIVLPDTDLSIGVQDESTFVVSESRPMVLDMPLINYLDDVPGSFVVYTGIAARFSRWEAATMWRAPEGETLAPDYAATARVPSGVTLTTLPATDAPYTPDESFALELSLRGASTDDFDSTDADGLLEGRNVLVVGAQGRWEVVYFRDVAVNTDSKVTLTGLLRGRRGTNINVNSHVFNDEWYLLRSVAEDFNAVGVVPELFDEALAGASYDYQAVGAVVRIPPPVLNITFVGGSLKPWSVVGVAAELVAADAVELTWNRRTRLHGPLEDGTGDIPLDEASEAYEIDILDGPGGLVVRTVTGLSTAFYSYSAANQTTDGFAPPLTEITVRVYQLSALVGRGYTEEVTVDVG